MTKLGPDWFQSDALLMRFYNGIDPNSLTMAQYAGYLRAIGDVLAVEEGAVDHRQIVDRMAERRLRREAHRWRARIRE